MSHWNTNTYDLGNIKQDKSKEFTFKGNLTMPKVVDFTSGCGCTKLKWDAHERELRVTFSSGKIPNQVHGNQVIEKYITVHYHDGSTELLTITGIKVR